LTLPDGLKVVEMKEERIFEISKATERAALAAKNAGVRKWWRCTPRTPGAAALVFTGHEQEDGPHGEGAPKTLPVRRYGDR
jgi:hypothetical protein